MLRLYCNQRYVVMAAAAQLPAGSASEVGVWGASTPWHCGPGDLLLLSSVAMNLLWVEQVHVQHADRIRFVCKWCHRRS